VRRVRAIGFIGSIPECRWQRDQRPLPAVPHPAATGRAPEISESRSIAASERKRANQQAISIAGVLQRPGNGRVAWCRVRE